MPKILIIRFSSIGDIVLTSPVVRILKEQVENAEIHFLTKEGFKSLVALNPNIDKVHTLKNSLSEVISQLKQEKFDYIIDLHNNLRSKSIIFQLKTKSKSFNKLNIEKWILVNLKANKLPDLHIVDRYLAAAQAFFEVKNDQKGLDFFFDEESKKFPKDFEYLKNEKYVAIAIGGQHATKKMNLKNLIKLCQKIESKIVVVGGKEDQQEGHELAVKVGKDKLINLCGVLSLQQSALVVEKASLLVTHDTGMMHIAAALKKNIVSIWGNTVPEFGMYPYLAGEKSKIFQVNDLRCRPCSKIGFDKCPKKHFYCMELQDVDSIADYVNQIKL